MSQPYYALIVGGPFHGVRYEGPGAPPQRLQLRLDESRHAVHELHAGARGLFYHFRETVQLRRPLHWTVEYVGLPQLDGYTQRLEWHPAEAADRVVIPVGSRAPHVESSAAAHTAARAAVFELRCTRNVYRYHFVAWQNTRSCRSADQSLEQDRGSVETPEESS